MLPSPADTYKQASASICAPAHIAGDKGRRRIASLITMTYWPLAGKSSTSHPSLPQHLLLAPGKSRNLFTRHPFDSCLPFTAWEHGRRGGGGEDRDGRRRVALAEEQTGGAPTSRDIACRELRRISASYLCRRGLPHACRRQQAWQNNDMPPLTLCLNLASWRALSPASTSRHMVRGYRQQWARRIPCRHGVGGTKVGVAAWRMYRLPIAALNA